MDGILEKFLKDASETPDRPLYNFLDCGTDPFKEEKVTIKEAWERAAAVAAALKGKGAVKGDRAVILSMQDCGTVYAVWGCMIAGVVFTLIPPPLDAGKLNRFVSVLKSCSPKFLISNEALEKTSENKVTGTLLKKAFFQVAALKRIYTDKVAPCKEGVSLCPHSADDVLYLQYTSGSTSAPKGVMVTYRNLMGCMELCQDIFNYRDTRQVLASWVPFYHNIGLVVAIFMPVFANHGVSLFIPTLQFLEKPSVWLQTLSQYKATITAAPNSAYEVCTRLFSPEEAKKFDLSEMTHFINGSETVDSGTVDKFCELFGVSHNSFAPGYGLSECVCVASLSSGDYRSTKIQADACYSNRFVPARDGDKTVVSLGRPGLDMKIVPVRGDGTPCKEGEIGEICLQGTNVCAGYFKNPKETEAFETVIPGYEGKFYHTGDMGTMYEGQLYLTGRIKEMIIVGGKNIFPSDIIHLLREEGIAIAAGAAAVFSVQKNGSEHPVLCAESEEGTDFESLLSGINKAVSHAFGFSFADIVFVKKDSLPRTDNRKIQTLAVRRAYENGGLSVLYSAVRRRNTEGGKDAAGTAPAKIHREKKLSLPLDSEDIRQCILDIFTSLLPGREIGMDDSFMELGGDSLKMMELVCELEHELHISIDVREVIAAPSVRGISDYLIRLTEGGPESTKPDLKGECVLAKDIRPEKPYEKKPEECANIFVTGTTGFLGAYLVRSLIRQRGGRVKIYCYGRGDSKEAVMERIEKNMRRFNCWEACYRDFIVPVPGDLNKPRLGIEEAVYETLADTMDMVIHNGAVLNFIFPYRQMKSTNVEGTAEALRFACHGKPKYFHYISSYSVYDNPSHFEREVSEDDPMESPEGYFLGYSETKWVAEKLVGIAMQRGLKCSIYRPGDITGTKEDGIWKLEDLISRSIVGCIQLKAMPDIDVNMHLTPVDYVADAIVHIAFQEESRNHAFNILNQNLMPLQSFYLLLNRLGYKAELLPFEEWCNRLEACTADENVLRILSCLFTDKRGNGESLRERFGKRQARMSTENTERLLSGSGILCPPVDAALMKRYLQYFAQCGYIPAPEERITGMLKGAYLSLKMKNRKRGRDYEE